MRSLIEIKNAYLTQNPKARGEKCFHWLFYYEFLVATVVCQNIIVRKFEHTLEILAGQKLKKIKKHSVRFKM